LKSMNGLLKSIFFSRTAVIVKEPIAKSTFCNRQWISGVDPVKKRRWRLPEIAI
jgi:hypothetical protein